MESGVYQLVIADAGVAAALAGGLMYPLVLPENVTAPSLTYQLISRVEEFTLDGPTGAVTSRLQIDAWAGTYAQVKALADAVRLALNGFAGALPDGTAVQNVMLENAMDLYEGPGSLYRVQQDWIVLHDAS